MIEAYKNFWKKTFKYKGVSSRAEFWWPFLINTIIWTALVVAGYFIDVVGIIDCVLAGLFICPIISVTVRRLHDTGRSGYNIFWIFLPIIGIIYLIIYLIDKPYRE